MGGLSIIWDWVRGRAVFGLALVAVLGLLVLGLAAVRDAARARLCQDGQYLLPFAAIACTPPAPLEREEFLAEVQYLATMPDSLCLLEDDLSRRLAVAFARHPWVERVERVEVVPPQHVNVRLAYRTPVLAVPYQSGLRAVDRAGILMPAKVATDGLPVYPGNAAPPAGPPGTLWGDAAVEQAARMAGGRHP